ncbi:D-isomer specific 2-hydroxyacid dehydrogenase, catalytic domain [Musa troglodytarum]|uniref:D-isomer specific 2-hydroxyacid dehydrogenase, catalytic domain n=1 Tax=Musa troglodytarum TaxID=320322 RepID=A0A9E7K3A9_9LILI|nr:D-isomer specific 2-hydroxyacid dehydrogenase, catalytic domain [Musa troglodytarum]
MASSSVPQGRPETERPQLLLLRPPLAALDEVLSGRFELLKSWESPLPLDRFLATHAANVRALLVIDLFTVDGPLLDALPALRFVCTTSAGVNHIDLGECARRGIAVANAGTVFSQEVAEYAVGLLIDVLRRVSACDRYVRRGLWPRRGDYPLGSKLGGKRVGIVGLGSIGSEVAKRLRAFGCPISYFSRSRKPQFPYAYFPSAADLAAHSDVLVVACALTHETHHIIDRDVMAALGKDGIIINVGRGALVDEAELVKRVMRGEIGGAGLDVFEHEPAVPEELFGVDNGSAFTSCGHANIRVVFRPLSADGG